MIVHIVMEDQGQQSYLIQLETSAVPEKGEVLNIVKERRGSTGRINREFFCLVIKERIWSNKCNKGLSCTLIVEQAASKEVEKWLKLGAVFTKG